jgi:FkbM family methyltransferase
MNVANIDVSGIRMRVNLLDEGVAHQMYDKREYEQVETNFVAQKLTSGAVFVDIGANIGFYSIQASKVVGPSGVVVAIEPEPYNLSLLKHNLHVNRPVSQIKILNIALGEHDGVAHLFKNASNFGDHRMYNTGADGRQSTAVSVRPFDDVSAELGLTRIDLIKMDVQGFECHVLRGMKRTLEVLRPSMILEFWPYGLQKADTSPEELLEIFAGFGYRVSRLDENGLIPITYEDVFKLLPPFDEKRPDASYLNLVFTPDLQGRATA